jgi:hypothetical protein
MKSKTRAGLRELVAAALEAARRGRPGADLQAAVCPDAELSEAEAPRVREILDAALSLALVYRPCAVSLAFRTGRGGAPEWLEVTADDVSRELPATTDEWCRYEQAIASFAACGAEYHAHWLRHVRRHVVRVRLPMAATAAEPEAAGR